MKTCWAVKKKFTNPQLYLETHILLNKLMEQLEGNQEYVY